jgi:trk system potassium uptake protein TrkA
MKFAIVGYGRVGARTADILSTEGHDVVIVEKDETKAQRAVDDTRSSGEAARTSECSNRSVSTTPTRSPR